MERKDLVKSTILELFRTAKDVIPRDYSQAELIQELLHEMIFLNVFQGDESKLRRISDFLRVPAHSERLFALYQMTLRGNLPTPADADFLDSDSILDATEPVTVTEDSAIAFARQNLKPHDIVIATKATFVGNVHSVWLISFEKADRSKVHYHVHSNGTTSLAGLVIEAYPNTTDWSGCIWLLAFLALAVLAFWARSH